ncbi:DNA polymerase delta small subunit [Scaptodrosophila lebanonensis]|uniref:DNA polymerase delta small subunit n=1 Tax=Drosophila lebanonensis TaxID=7225 RepID=A0A6J2TZE8_DROLE|nr:DNA polymerase delta small subunit [Scaptodrosophila lebanonensis]
MAERLECTYQNLSSRFLVKSFDYQKQFCHLYAHRLGEMSRLLTPIIQKKLGSQYPIKKLCELRGEQNITCIIIGTIYKHQAHKPSILRDISEENQLAPQPQRQNYSEPEDKVILEDELQRVRLQLDQLQGHLMATGVVCAVLGDTDSDGHFDVKEIIYHESGPQRPLTTRGHSRLLVLVSGLDQLQAHNYYDALNMFQYWLSGSLGNSTDAKSMLRLIVAGNSVRSTAVAHVPTLQVARNQANANDTVQAVTQLDSWFASWAQALNVDVMPGAYDPANFMLPQQPFHRCMFPQASELASFQAVSNPYACLIDDALVVGTAGQNVADLLRSTSVESSLQALRCTLTWGHLAPTSPDTLACYPYTDNDPFIMHECPHVYFAGNCDSFETELHVGADGKQTRLICVPNFSKTQSVAVVDLDTLDCRQIDFNVDGS